MKDKKEIKELNKEIDKLWEAVIKLQSKK